MTLLVRGDGPEPVDCRSRNGTRAAERPRFSHKKRVVKMRRKKMGRIVNSQRPDKDESKLTGVVDTVFPGVSEGQGLEAQWTGRA